MTYFHGKTQVTELVLHCAALNAQQVRDFARMTAAEAKAEVTAWHLARGFKDIGYHGIIMPDGQFIRCRAPWTVGAHVRGHNKGKLGFLLVEHAVIDRIGLFVNWFTISQRTTLQAKLHDLARNHGVARVSGHNDYANRLCPGFRVQSQDWLPL